MRIICVSPFSRETYNALANWVTDARTLASPNIVIVMVGNKKDLDSDREVTFMEASRFAQENGQLLSLSLSLLFSPLSFNCGSLPCRAGVPRDECTYGRECGGGISEVYAIHSHQD